MSYDYDLYVIGGGSGGIATARRVADYGAKVGLAEFDRLGGTCVNRGCIPKKLMVYASHFPDLYEDATGYGWSPVETPRFDWQKLTSAIETELQRLNGVYDDKLAKVDLHRDYASLVDAHTIRVGDRTVTADKILIAVGGVPKRPPIPGSEHAIISDRMFDLPEQPKRMGIIGDGYIGVEFACIMHHLGTEVTQFIKRDKILKGFDPDLQTHLQEQMVAQGIRFMTYPDHGGGIAQIVKTDDGLRIELNDGESVTVDLILAATGRHPNLDKLGLENAGVEVKNGAIAVNEYSRTSQPNIYAVGDCTDRINLTPVAIREGRAFADTEFGNMPRLMDHDNVPSAVFASPEAASVGLTEPEAIARHGEAAIGKKRIRFAATYYALAPRRVPTMMKVIYLKDSERIIGVHVVGDHAAEIMQGIAIAVKMGATLADFHATIGIHPSVAEEFTTI